MVAASSVFTVNSISALEQFSPGSSSAIYASGYYHQGDGGGGQYVWEGKSRAQPNGGTVIASRVISEGRWHLQHYGIGDFRMFGIMDDSQPADAALDALVNDPSIVEIRAFSNLLFQKRHRFQRSGITLDFQSFQVFTKGIEPTKPQDYFGSVLFFQGQPEDETITVILTETMPDQTDIFPVNISSEFRVGEWYAVQVDPLPGEGRDARELQKLVQVTAIPNNTHIQVNYYNGWELTPGRKITWRKVTPVQNITVKNMRFIGAGETQETGSQPLAFEYAIYTNAENIASIGAFWSAIMRRWNTYYRTIQCSLVNPPSTATGGAGYLTQQIYCLYGQVSNCHVSNARHLNDFTASAYCLVENCHADGQSAEKGPFVTHGQYEHDLTYIGNSGLMTFANSGPQWGSATRRVLVSKHVCPWFVARYGVSELTLVDMAVIANKDIPSSGMIWVNADGLQMSGCTGNAVLRITQASQRSARPNLITGCSFTLSDEGSQLVNDSVVSPISFCDTRFLGLSGHIFGGKESSLSFTRCEFLGIDDKAVTFSSKNTFFDASQFQNCHITLAANNQDVSMVNLQLDTCQLDFGTFPTQPDATLIFCQNKLRYTKLKNLPKPGKNIICEPNIILD